MANVKKIIAPWSETAITTYAIVRREVDGFLLNDADGAFANAPVDPYVSLAEHGTLKGIYELSESRTVWNDGRYTATVYKQAGGSPVPASDRIIGTADTYIASDLEVVVDASVSTRAVEGNVETHVTASLNAYDPPTRAEATTDKESIIAEVNANETKIDAIKAKTDTILWTDITRLLGLTLDNAVEDDVVRDGNGNKTSSILYHYNSAANATTHDKVTGVVGKYGVTAGYVADRMTLFKVLRVT